MKDDFKPLRPRPAFVPVAAERNQNTSQMQPGGQGSVINPGNKPSGELPEPHAHKLSPENKPQPPKNKGKKWHPKTWWHWFKGLSRNKKIIVLSALAGLLISGSALAYYLTRPEPPPPPPAPVVKEEPKPEVFTSELTGVKVTKKQSKLPVTGVMIENSPDARPQSGLYHAGVVFEAISEGGITRFLALYQESKPERIGPVRSARPQFLDFHVPFDAPLAHAGGSPQALAEIAHQKIKDLEAFRYPNHYERISTRYAPHNLYTGRSRLLEIHKQNGWNTSKFNGFKRKEAEKAKKPNARKIDFNISSHLYNVHYDYDGKTNSYKRVMGGVPHNDEAAKKQNNPKVVVALVMSHSYAGIYSVYGSTGKGRAFVFQDGKVQKVFWQKSGRKSQLKFIDKNKKPVALNPGQTWITLVGSPSAVSYK